MESLQFMKFYINDGINSKVSHGQRDIRINECSEYSECSQFNLNQWGGINGAIHKYTRPGLSHECWKLYGCETSDSMVT